MDNNKYLYIVSAFDNVDDFKLQIKLCIFFVKDKLLINKPGCLPSGYIRVQKILWNIITVLKWVLTPASLNPFYKLIETN